MLCTPASAILSYKLCILNLGRNYVDRDRQTEVPSYLKDSLPKESTYKIDKGNNPIY